MHKVVWAGKKKKGLSFPASFADYLRLSTFFFPPTFCGCVWDVEHKTFRFSREKQKNRKEAPSFFLVIYIRRDLIWGEHQVAHTMSALNFVASQCWLKPTFLRFHLFVIICIPLFHKDRKSADNLFFSDWDRDITGNEIPSCVFIREFIIGGGGGI